MTCETEIWHALEAGREEGIKDDTDNLRAFNDVFDPRIPMEDKRIAIEKLRKNSFTKTPDALEAWLKCVTS